MGNLSKKEILLGFFTILDLVSWAFLSTERTKELLIRTVVWEKCLTSQDSQLFQLMSSKILIWKTCINSPNKIRTTWPVSISRCSTTIPRWSSTISMWDRTSWICWCDFNWIKWVNFDKLINLLILKKWKIGNFENCNCLYLFNF
jgi:hypothetical protein